jgi:hypothetical protein
MPITASKYINNSDSQQSYIGVFQYERPERTKKDEKVSIYGLLSVSSEIDIPGQSITKFAWDGIVDGFEYSKVDSTNESLKLALKEGVRRVKQLIKNDKKIGEYGVNVDFTIFVSNGAGIYIGLIGESDIYVYKEGRLVDISDMLRSKKAKTAAIALDENDFLFSSTKGFLKENIGSLMGAKNEVELVSTLEVLGDEIGKQQGLLVFLKKEERKKEKSKEMSGEVTLKIGEENSIEPKESDYIPMAKVEKRKILKSPEQEKDLKTFFSNLFAKTKEFLIKMSKSLKPVKGILLGMYKKISPIPRKIFSKVSEKF